MSNFAFYNGLFSEYGSLGIPLSDRALFFGDGVYDAAVGFGGKIYRYHEHYERLARGAKEIGLKLNYSEKELRSILGELISLSSLQSYFLYFQLSAVGGVRKHERKIPEDSNLLATVNPWEMPKNDGCATVTLCEDIRHGRCDIKTLNLLPPVLCASDAAMRGFDECCFLFNGFVTECAHSNIFMLKDGALITSPTSRRVLSGITRARIIELAKDADIAIRVRNFTKDELLSADEVFISSTSRAVTRVSKINNTNFPVKTPFFERISTLLQTDYASLEEN